MWEHVGVTGHIASTSYRTQTELRFLLTSTTDEKRAPSDRHRYRIA
jgi:hypothetical protein